MPRRRILHIEDDDDVVQILTPHLEMDGFDVTSVGTGAEALDVLATDKVDLVLLDLGLPDGNGIDVFHEIRARHRSLPILVLTGRTDQDDEKLFLELGADDYMLKLRPKAIVARVRKSLREKPPPPSLPHGAHDDRRLGNVVFSDASRSIRVNGVERTLTRLEILILDRLWRAQGTVVSTDDLINFAWNDVADPAHIHALTTHVTNLRGKLDGGEVEIKSVRRIGYRLTAKEPLSR